MPNFDGTGPGRMGNRTGRGFGPCGLGLGWRRKFGTRRGLGRYFGSWADPATKEEKLVALSEYKKALKEELEDITSEEKELGKE